MTIKEKIKNNKFKYKQPEKEKENLNKSQNILLYKILKNKNKKANVNISIDSSINKTIENTFTKDENKKKVLNYLKNKNKQIPKTSAVSPSKSNERGVSPSFFNGNNKSKIEKDDYDSSYCKQYKNKKIQNSKVITPYKAVTPKGDFRNKKNVNNSIEGRKLYGAAYKKREGDNNNISRKDYNAMNTSQNTNRKQVTPEKNILDSKRENNSIKKKKEKNNINMKYNYLTSTYSALIKQHDKMNLSVNNNNNINKVEHHNYRKKDSNNFSSNSNISINKEKKFENLQRRKVDLFTINNSIIKKSIIEEKSKNLSFKFLNPEKNVELSLESQIKVKPVQKKENTNIIKDQYTGFVLLKKNLGNIEKEIKLDNNIEKIKSTFIFLLSEISKEQYELILSNELLKLKNEINKNINLLDELNNIKNENILKNQKIQEQEDIIQKKEEEYFENQKQYLKLQSNYDKIKQEKDQMYEKIKNIEKENKKIIEDSGKLKEEYITYKNKKDEKMNSEIKDLEDKIKKYKEELKKTSNNNNLKNSFKIDIVNKKNKRFSVSYNFKSELLLNKLENKKNEKNNIQKLKISEENKIKEDTEEKQSNESDSESNMSDQIKDIEKESEKVSAVKEKEKKKEEPIINNIIINNINNNINNTNEIEINKVKTFPNTITSKENDDSKSLSLPKIPEEKQKKMSKALNRFKKKFSQVNQGIASPENFNSEKNRSVIKKSDRISGIAKLLEKQMGAAKKDENNEMNNDSKPIIDKEIDKENEIVDLITKKPTAGGRKRKPTINIKLKQKKLIE